MTWKEIKDKIEELGVKDEDRLSYIDISCDLLADLSTITATKSENKTISVNEWRVEN